MGNHPRLKNVLKLKQGFSLFELLLSLAIFSIVMGAFISLPVKTAQRSEALRDTEMVLQETSEIFGDHIKYELGRTRHLYPLTLITTANIGGDEEERENRRAFDPAKQVFFAYFDPKKQRVYRVGYTLFRNEKGNYNIYRAVIGANALLSSYSLVNPEWQNYWQPLGKNSENSITELRSSGDIRFQYCQGDMCSNDLLPKNADGLRIVAPSNQALEAIHIAYHDGQTTLPSLYFRLGSDLTDQSASMGIYPFSVELSQWDSKQTLLKDMVDGLTGTRRLAQDLAEASATTTSPILVTDSYHDNNSGKLTIVGQSTSPGDKTFYINRLEILGNTYSGYQSTGSFFPTSSGFEGSGGNNFPITLQPGEPGNLGNHFTFKSVTQDEDGEIYVLATSAAPSVYLLHFSNSGEFIAANNITGDASEALSDAYGIAYSPSTPEELHVLARVGTSYIIRTYDKAFQDNSMPTMNSHTAQSTELNVERIRGPFNFAQYQLRGLEIIPRTNQYAILGCSNNNDTCSVVGFPMSIHDTADVKDNRLGRPFDRGFFIPSFYAKGSNKLGDCQGISIDFAQNLLFTVSDASSSNPKVEIIGLNTELQRTYQ